MNIAGKTAIFLHGGCHASTPRTPARHERDTAMDINSSSTVAASAKVPALIPFCKRRASASAKLDPQLAGDIEALIDRVVEIDRLEGEVAGLKAAIGPLARRGIRTKRAEVKYRGARIMDVFSRPMPREALIARHGMEPGEADRLLASSVEGRRTTACVVVKLRRGR